MSAALNVASSGKNHPDIAFLVFRAVKYRRANESFDGNDNIGARVVANELEKSGLSVGFCSPETAHKYKIVMVSLTSTYDVIAFYRSVALRNEWQPQNRTFKVLVGGFGMQNPTSIRNYVDYAYFGRSEDHIVGIVDDILGGRIPCHSSLMNLPDLHEVEICQATGLYSDRFKVGKKDKQWFETFIGCPNKCRFCHYTWARKHIGTSGEYLQDTNAGSSSPEVLWRDIINLKSKPGRLRTAIDGFSERLRHNFGKKIRRDEIIEGINRIGRFNGRTTIMAYNIANMPTETDDDRQELYDSIRASNPFNRVIFVLHSTPFRPSPMTPMSHCEATLFPNWSRKIGKDAIICDRENLLAMHSRQMESPRSHLETLIVERATPDSDKLFHAICFAPKLINAGAMDWLRRVEANFDLSQYVRRYDPEERIPTWFLSGWVGIDAMDKAIKWVDRQL